MKGRPSFIAGGAIAVLLSCAACGPGRPAPGAERSSQPGEAETATREAPSADRGATALIRLPPEAAAVAGVATEVIHTAPFAATLALPARLSPQPETADEMEARLTYRAAEARYRRASADLDRVRKLVAEDVAASKAVQTAEAEFAQAQVDRLRAETALRNQGIEASPELPTFPDAGIWALAEAYEAQVDRIRAGERAFVTVESAPGETFQGRVVSLARSLKAETRTLTVRIAVSDPRRRLRPQEQASAEVQIGERNALSVPLAALLYEGSDRVLFVKRPGGFERVRVGIGARAAGRVEIVRGLADGDEVVTRGAAALLGEVSKKALTAGEDGGGSDDGGD